jgi:hypothetical protein
MDHVRIHPDAALGAAVPISLPLKTGPGMNEGEVDVEEDGSSAGHRVNYRM